MNKKLISTVLLLLLTCFFTAFTSQSQKTINCSVFIGNVEEMEVQHEPISEINGLGNTIVLKSYIFSRYEAPVVKIKYRLNDKDLKEITATVLQETGHDYVVSFGIPSDYLSVAGELTYAMKVIAGSDIKYFPESLDDNSDDYHNFSTATLQNVDINLSATANIESSIGGILSFNSGHNKVSNLRVVVPPNAFSTADGSDYFTATQLLSYQNKSSDDIILAQYEFSTSQNITKFDEPITIRIAYPDEDNDGYINVGGNTTTYNEKNLRVFYWNELNEAWEIVGGTVDPANNSITFQTMHFSLFAIFYVDLTKESFRPLGRIITPNGDGFNDKVEFANLETDLPSIKIMDINGRLVRKVSTLPYEWDGRDESGRVVESGIYIYQFKVNIKGKVETVSGTLAIAK
ncbi:MAG: hypothetical protein GY817_05875 [bacterium]|nr:hypothetical protein [bacterium]